MMPKRLADHEETSSTNDSRFDAKRRDKEDEVILTEIGFEFVGKPLSTWEYGKNDFCFRPNQNRRVASLDFRGVEPAAGSLHSIRTKSR